MIGSGFSRYATDSVHVVCWTLFIGHSFFPTSFTQSFCLAELESGGGVPFFLIFAREKLPVLF